MNKKIKGKVIQQLSEFFEDGFEWFDMKRGSKKWNDLIKVENEVNKMIIKYYEGEEKNV